jgi:arylsulfatase A-like enzyme
MHDVDQPHQGRFPYDLELFRSHFLADRTIEFIKDTAKEHVPFVAVCSFFGPHAPYQIPEPYYSLYSPDDVELPISFYEDDSDKPEALRRWDPGKWSRDWPEEKWRSIMAVYFGYLTLIDAEIGRLLDVLDDLELSEETFVLFVADHGEMNGAHRYLYKGPYFFDETLRIPFIVRYPPLAVSGIINDDIVSSLDIMPTIMEIAGLDKGVTCHGHSLTPLLVGESGAGRDHVYSEMYDFDAGAQAFWCPMRCYRDRRWKFVERLPIGTEGEELYDLANDPYELHNLAGQPTFSEVRDRLWAALRDEAAVVNDPWPNIPATAPDWYRILRGLPDWYSMCHG